MANQNPLISVIVPVYKVEKYLHRCVDSILAQTYTNLEIILIDDGSPDRSGEICDEYAAKDGRIRVIHQENTGVSAARNAGLDFCTGEFIAFVDSDDYIEHDMISQLLIGIEDANICRCGLIRHDHQGEVSDIIKTDREISLTGYEVLRQHYSGENGHQKISISSVWSQLFKQELFKQLRFSNGLLFEDIHIMPYLLTKCQKVRYLPYAGYHYMTTADSITTKDTPAHVKKCYEDCFRIWDDHEAFYRAHGWNDLVDDVSSTRADKIMTHMLENEVPPDCEDWSRKLLRQTVCRLMSRPVGAKRKLRYAAFCLIGKNGYALLKKLSKYT